MGFRRHLLEKFNSGGTESSMSSSILGFQIPSIAGLSRSPDLSYQSSPFITYRKRISFSEKSPLSRTLSPRYHASVASSLTSRFESLYNNAIATRRCHDQMRKQAEKFKEKHALDGCTFNPRLISRSYTPKQLTPRQREMETMNRVVERMRRAAAIREEKLKYTLPRTGTNAILKSLKPHSVSEMVGSTTLGLG